MPSLKFQTCEFPTCHMTHFVKQHSKNLVTNNNMLKVDVSWGVSVKSTGSAKFLEIHFSSYLLFFIPLFTPGRFGWLSLPEGHQVATWWVATPTGPTDGAHGIAQLAVKVLKGIQEPATFPLAVMKIKKVKTRPLNFNVRPSLTSREKIRYLSTQWAVLTYCRLSSAG